MTGISRRTFQARWRWACSFARRAAQPDGVRAQWLGAGKEISIGIWAVLKASIVRKNIIPAFEKDFGCSVTAEEGFTLANVAKMRATKANPKFSVMFIDDVAIPICSAEDLIAELPKDKMPSAGEALSALSPTADTERRWRFRSRACFTIRQSLRRRAMPICGIRSGRGKIKLVSPKNTPSVFFLIVAASVKSGKPFAQAQYEIDGAFDKVAELKPNVQTSSITARKRRTRSRRGRRMSGCWSCRSTSIPTPRRARR